MSTRPHELLVAGAEVVVRDAARPGEQVEAELGRLLIDVHADVLEPLQRGLGGPLGGLDDGPPLGLVGRQRGLHVRVFVQAGGEGERVLHRQLGAGTDREVCGVRGVADEDEVAVVPPFVAYGGEVEPLRVVGEDVVAREFPGEESADALDGLLVGDARRELDALGGVEAGAAPDVLVHLDDEGGAAVGVGVAVDLHGPPLGLLDEELEGLEDPVGAEPHVLVVAPVQGGAEDLRMGRPNTGVGSVGGDHQVVRGGQAVGGGRPEAHVDPEGAAALLEQAEKFLAAHGGEALPADGVALAAEVDVDVGPAGEPPCHGLGELGVGVLDAAECLVGEDHAEAEGVVGGVALPDGDVVGRVELFHESSEVEAAGATANDRDLQGGCSSHCSPSGTAGAAACWASCACSASTIFRSAKRWSLPLVLRGRESRNRTSRGYL